MNNLVFYLLGRFTSLFGTGLLNIALPLYILNKTSSASTLGTFLGVIAIPSILFSPFLGGFVEVKNKKYLMIITDFLQFILYLYLFFISKDVSLVVLGVFLTSTKLIGKVFSLSSSTIFSHIIDKKYFEKGNSIKSILDNISYFVSPLVGVLIYNKFGIGSIFLINGITFGVSALLECFIKYKHKVIVLEKKNILKNLLVVKELIVNNKKLKNLFIVIMLSNFILSPLFSIILPYLALKINHIGNSNYAITNSLFIGGSILGASLVFLKNKSLSLLKLLNINSFLFIVIGSCSYLFMDKSYVFFVILGILSLLFGAITSLINIPIISGFQKTVPQDMQGRFFGILSLVGGVLVPLGDFLLGRSTLYLPAQLTIVIVSIFSIIIATYLLKFKQN